MFQIVAVLLVYQQALYAALMMHNSPCKTLAAHMIVWVDISPAFNLCSLLLHLFLLKPPLYYSVHCRPVVRADSDLQLQMLG